MVVWKVYPLKKSQVCNARRNDTCELQALQVQLSDTIWLSRVIAGNTIPAADAGGGVATPRCQSFGEVRELGLEAQESKAIVMGLSM